jgi:hypothetical protein
MLALIEEPIKANKVLKILVFKTVKPKKLASEID